MREALALAKKAFEMGEVPVGAVAVWDGKIVGRGMNRRETDKNALHHAEVEAIDEACRSLKGWRRCHRCQNRDCYLYVTLEPCPMCAGAIINSRVRRLVFGAKDAKAGSCGSVVDMFALPYNHKPEVTAGVLEKECSELLTDFFEQLREKHKKEKENIKL